MSFLPISEYSQIRQQYLAKLTTLLLVLLLIMVGSCIFFSHKYLVPILNGLKTLKKETTSEDLKKQLDEMFNYVSQTNKTLSLHCEDKTFVD